MLSFIHPFPFTDVSNSHNICLLVYHIPPNFTPVVKSNGNSKLIIAPFIQLGQVPKNELMMNSRLKFLRAPYLLFLILFEVLLCASAPVEFSKNEKQVSNFKKKLSNSCNCASDQLFTVMQQAYSDDPAHKFICAVNAAPEPAVVVATDKQLHDVVHFCTSLIDFSSHR